MGDIRALYRVASRLGILASIAYLIAGMAFLPVERVLDHARILLYGALLLFPHSVALAYVASGFPGRIPALLGSGAYASLALLAAPALGLLYSPSAALALFLVVFIVMVLTSGYVASGRRGSLRLSLALVALSYLVSSLVIAAILTLKGEIGLFSEGLALTIAYPLTLIYAVTVHSLPSTFRDSPLYMPASVLPALTLLASLLALNDYVSWSSLAVLASMALYAVAAKLYRLPTYARSIEELRGKSPAYGGLRFFIEGHYAILAIIAITAIYTLAGPLLWRGPQALLLIHLYAIGFTLGHIVIHAPMMLPVVLGVKHKRRYTRTPYIAVAAAATLWPIAPELSYAMITVALVSIIYIVRWP